MGSEEKRLYPRLSLKVEDGYFAHFKMANNESLPAPILNLSAGGINVLVPQKAAHKIKEGDLLLLQNIAGAISIQFLNDVNADIRWIKKADRPDYVSVGCRFRAFSEEVQRQLNRFVDSERMSRGQYT